MSATPRPPQVVAPPVPMPAASQHDIDMQHLGSFTARLQASIQAIIMHVRNLSSLARKLRRSENRSTRAHTTRWMFSEALKI